jgi:hypothetical protein
MRACFLQTCFVMLFCIISCKEPEATDCLIDDFRFDMPAVKHPEELLGGNVRKIQPEATTSESLIGNVNKIIKHGDDFYILSDDRRILHFSGQGKFLSSLDKRGGGPEEYAMLTDFDVHETTGETEIWLSDFNRIRRYVLTDGKWQFRTQIKFDGAVNKFKIIDGRYLLLLAGQDDESLLLTDMAGVPLNRYLKKEIPFLIFKPVQFVRHDSGFVFQLGASNGGVLFDTKTLAFRHVKITGEEFLSASALSEMFRKKGYDYLRDLSQRRSIRGFRRINDNIWLDFFRNGERFVAVRHDGFWRKMKIDIDGNSMPALATIGMSDSPDSFILFEYPQEDDNLNITVYEYRQ